MGFFDPTMRSPPAAYLEAFGMGHGGDERDGAWPSNPMAAYYASAFNQNVPGPFERFGNFPPAGGPPFPSKGQGSWGDHGGSNENGHSQSSSNNTSRVEAMV
jgi:hypothetical protein